MKTFYFNKYYKLANILSLVLIIISVIFLIFKGLNYGVDFKGGTLIELRVHDKNISISNVRDSFNSLNLNGVNVKKFGNQTDYIIKFQNTDVKNPDFVNEIKKNLQNSSGYDFSFRRVENVGPKVSSELLKSGIIAIALSLFAMLFYIWVRFEWQFSIGAIMALFHDVIVHLVFFRYFP